MFTKEQLERMSTQRLYTIYRSYFVCCAASCCYHDEDEGSDYYFDVASTIKAILDTREHLPRKPRKAPRKKSQRHKYQGKDLKC